LRGGAALFSTVPEIVTLEELLDELDRMFTTLLNLPSFPLESKLTMMEALSPGLIGSFGHSTMVQPQLACV